MKITRKQLRRLIAEALDEGKRIIVDPEGEAFVASNAYQAGAAKDAQSFGYNPKLDKMKRGTYSQDPLADQRQARELATAMGLQDELSAGEETAVEMGQKKAMAPDLKFHNELPGTKSIELAQRLKRECKKRGFACTIKDERNFDPEDPFIVVHVVGKHPLRGNNIDVSIHLSDSWMGSTKIEIYNKGELDPDVTIPAHRTKTYFTNRPSSLYGLRHLAQLVIDSASEL